MKNLKFEYKITLAYLIIGGLWIIFTDNLLHFYIPDHAVIKTLQTYKGWFYVIVTAVIFFLYLKKYLNKQRATEEIIQLNERKLNAIFNHHYQLTGLIDTDGRLLMANQTFLMFSDVKENDLYGKLFWDGPWWEGIDTQDAKEAFNLAVKGEFVRINTYHTNHKGEQRYFDFSFNPVKDKNGKVLYVVPEGRDVTELKIKEQELTESEEKYRSFFMNSSDAMFLLKDAKIIDCNPAAVKMLGCQNVAEVINLRPDEISPEFQPDGKKSSEKVIEFIQIAYNKGAHRFEWEHKRKNGELFPVEVSFTYIKYGDEEVMQAVWFDISDRKSNEVELEKHRKHLEELVKERTKQLEEKNKELEHYIGLFHGREFRIKELKNKIKEMEKRIQSGND